MVDTTQSQGNGQMLAVGNNIVKNLSQIYTALVNAFVVQSSGSFTLAAAASTTVKDANVKSTSRIISFPTNAAAGTLQGSAKSLYVSAKIAGTSFTVSTASGGNAAGTEQFDYILVNLH